MAIWILTLLLFVAPPEKLVVPHARYGVVETVDEREARGGLAVSLWQIRIGAGATLEGWTRSDLQRDRPKAIRTALRLLKKSLAACRRFGPSAGLRAYASGSCAKGQKASAERLGLAERLLAL